MDRFWPTAAFPWGTLLVNVAGCVAIGAMAGLAETRQVLSPEARLLLVVGVLGSFTTFSTLGFETFEITREGAPTLAIANMALHVALGMAGVWSGFQLALRSSAS